MTAAASASILVGWLMIHGVTELLAIVLCGAAGLMLGDAIAFPGAQSRLANLAQHGRRAARWSSAPSFCC